MLAGCRFLFPFAAVIAMTSVLLVFQMGQPRIWMSMSRDGLLPPVFQKIHPKFKTPSFATIVTGLVVGVPILFTDKTFVLDFTSIATLFAFVLVCGGVLLIPGKEKVAGRFHIPYINGQFIFPLIVAGATLLCLRSLSKIIFGNLFNFDFSANEDYNQGKISFMDAGHTKYFFDHFLDKCFHTGYCYVHKKIFPYPVDGAYYLYVPAYRYDQK